MKTTPKSISDKQKYPETIFVENLGDKNAPEFITETDPSQCLGMEEMTCEVAVYQFKKIVVVTREDKIVVTDK